MAKDIHQEITNRLINAIEAGTMPWRQPWAGGPGGLPIRSTGQAYSGINILLLWMEAQDKGYSSQHWFTFKQAKTLGAQVHKGEKSTRIVFYSTFEKEIEGKKECQIIPFLRTYNVFNGDQIEGLPEKFQVSTKPAGATPITKLEAFFKATKAKIKHGGTKAYYRPAIDAIQMPEIAAFFKSTAYYQTLAHEIIHWSGAEHRLNRLKKSVQQKEYAFEELIAEIGSCFLGSQVGFEPDIEQSAAYVETWLKALKNDKKFIFKAASHAQKACDFVMALQDQSKPDCSTQKTIKAPVETLAPVPVSAQAPDHAGQMSMAF